MTDQHVVAITHQRGKLLQRMGMASHPYLWLIAEPSAHLLHATTMCILFRMSAGRKVIAAARRGNVSAHSHVLITLHLVHGLQ